MRSRKLVWFLLLGVLLALSGCGSDGNGGSAMDGMGNGTMNMQALNAAKAAAMEAYNAAKQAVAAVEANKSADMASYDKAVAQRNAAMEANTKAQATDDVAEAEKYRDMAQTANTNAMKYANMVTTAANDAAGRAMAAKIAPAIADPDGDEEFPEAGDLRASSRPGGAGVTITVVAGGAVTVDPDGPTTADTATTYADTLGEDDKWNHDVDTDGDGSGTPDRSRANQFTMQTAAPPMLTGFDGSVHERTVGDVTDTLTVYTNVENPKPQAYGTYYSDADAGNRDGVVSADSGVLTLDVNANTGKLSLFSGSRIPTGSNQSFVIPGADDAATENVKENEFTGTFNNVPGTYTCTGGCTLVTDGMGELTITGTLTFTPTETDHTKIMIPGVVMDADFLTFGYWLQATEDDEGETTYGVRTFATGGTLYTLANIQIGEVQGTATYAGPATGMYVKKTFNDRGVGTPSASGQFTGDASLTAHFSGGDVTPNNSLSISGEVTNFRDGQGNVIDDMWTVELMKAGFASSGDNATKDGLPDNTFGGATTGEGEWQGQFFGMYVPDTDTDTTGNQSSMPTGVAGEFNGHFSNGHVIGAFGATKDK